MNINFVEKTVKNVKFRNFMNAWGVRQEDFQSKDGTIARRSGVT